MSKPKLIAMVGPTATGKSDAAVRLAKAIGGEIVSADSRQVYRGMNLGTGKITKREMRGIPHHLLDVASPARQYSVARYTRDAKKAIASILKKGAVPIVVGGTGLYVDALIRGHVLPDVPPDARLRAKLEKLSTEKLFALLKKKDPRRAKAIDRHNRRRLIRALEIASALGRVPKTKPVSEYDALFVGLSVPMEKLRAKIRARLRARMKAGMIAEAKRLRANGLSWKRMHELGLEYRYLALHLQGKLSREEMLVKLETEICRYAKRQMTWFKRHSDIHWFSPNESARMARQVRTFLRSR